MLFNYKFLASTLVLVLVLSLVHIIIYNINISIIVSLVLLKYELLNQLNKQSVEYIIS